MKHLIFCVGKKDINIKVIVVIDMKLPLGSGQACHRCTVKKIMLHPRSDHPFPWNTIRHELLHILLKKQIKLKFLPMTNPLVRGLNYNKQSTRDNVEEYIVRILNNLFLRTKKGNNWYEAQLIHERQSGFRRIRIAAHRLESWQLSKKPFSAKIFQHIAKTLIH